MNISFSVNQNMLSLIGYNDVSLHCSTWTVFPQIRTMSWYSFNEIRPMYALAVAFSSMWQKLHTCSGSSCQSRGWSQPCRNCLRRARRDDSVRWDGAVAQRPLLWAHGGTVWPSLKLAVCICAWQIYHAFRWRCHFQSSSKVGIFISNVRSIRQLAWSRCNSSNVTSKWIFIPELC